MLACGDGASEPTDPARVKALLDAGADVNAADVNGYSALMFAANEPEAVKVLLAYGAKVNAINANHTTALIEASKDGNTESVRLLIQAGADVQLGGPSNTALWWAKSTQHDETARILEAAGARE
jgi:ankyrin repeat protein